MRQPQQVQVVVGSAAAVGGRQPGVSNNGSERWIVVSQQVDGFRVAHAADRCRPSQPIARHRCACHSKVVVDATGPAVEPVDEQLPGAAEGVGGEQAGLTAEQQRVAPACRNSPSPVGGK